MNTLIIILITFGTVLLWFGNSKNVKERVIEHLKSRFHEEGKEVSSHDLYSATNKCLAKILRYGFLLFMIGFSILLYKYIG